MGVISRWAAQSVARTLAWLKSNPHFRNLYATLTYDEKNREAFAQVDLQERMLADEVRFEAYQRAIAKHVREGDTVLDVGTGSGILSFLASGQRPGKIFAIDHSQIIDVAKLIADRNGVSNIEFLNLNTMSEADLPNEFRSRKLVLREGRLDGFCLFFSVIFDGEISFSTFPSFKRTHWATPLFRVESRSCRKGDPLGFQLKIGDIRNPNTWILQTRE